MTNERARWQFSANFDAVATATPQKIARVVRDMSQQDKRIPGAIASTSRRR
jgi:hypothetical protein